jgi:spore maturation protein CgeB
MVRLGLASAEWDLILFKDRAAANKYRLLGLNAHVLHEAMNPEWHRPVSGVANGETAIVGNWYGYRQSLVRALVARGVHVGLYGTPPPRWSLPEVRHAHLNRYVVREEKSRVFGEALACLNSFQTAEGDSLNCRAFEVAGAGGLQLIEDRPAISECFVPGKEILPFSSIDEVISLIDRARSDPGWAAEVRAAGARRALASHSYRHRIDAILRLLELR